MNRRLQISDSLKFEDLKFLKAQYFAIFPYM